MLNSRRQLKRPLAMMVFLLTLLGMVTPLVGFAQTTSGKIVGYVYDTKGAGVVDAIVMWPKMDVVGADIAGSIEKLKGLGYWVEAALFFPQPDCHRIFALTLPDFGSLLASQGRFDRVLHVHNVEAIAGSSFAIDFDLQLRHLAGT